MNVAKIIYYNANNFDIIKQIGLEYKIIKANSIIEIKMEEIKSSNQKSIVIIIPGIYCGYDQKTQQYIVSFPLKMRLYAAVEIYKKLQGDNKYFVASGGRTIGTRYPLELSCEPDMEDPPLLPPEEEDLPCQIGRAHV